MRPPVGGIYAGNPENLSIAALLPRQKQLELDHGSVVRGAATKALAGMDPRFDPRRRNLFSFRQGMASLPQQAAATLGTRIWSWVRAESLSATAGGGFPMSLRDRDYASTLRVDSLVVALPAYATARVLTSMALLATKALAAIAHSPLAVGALGYRRAQITHPLDGLGVLAPTVERRKVLGMLFSSILFTQRAPNGHVLLTAYVGGARQPELASMSRQEIIAMVKSEARDLLGAAVEPVFDSLRYWRQGLPQLDLGHANQIDTLHQLEAEYPGPAITGNYVSGVSTAACIDAAVAAAARLARKSALAPRRAANAPTVSSATG